MIGRLKGIVLTKEPPALLLDVNGVGYELEAPMSTFYSLPPTGETVTLHTHLVVREDAQLLYGFARDSERRLFRALLKVSGVGPRVALAVLSGLSEAEFSECIATEDVARITRVPGIGKKTAERLIIEMRDKIDENVVTSATGGTAREASLASPVGEAVSALMALGYKAPEASRLVRDLETEGASTEEIIRMALKRAAG